MEGRNITYKEIRNNDEIATYISQADMSLASMGYTDHSFGHVKKCAKLVKEILETFGYSPREVELGQIAAYMHDIGNVVNRCDHAQSGAIMAFQILKGLNMNSKEIATIVSAIGNHDEGTGFPVSATAAALILADKTDVRRSRVRNPETYEFNIHDRVNYSVKKSEVTLDKENRMLTLTLNIDTKITPVMDYFEIFLNRMSLCKKAAKKLNIWFRLIINDLELI
jgi:metal-dependent HD superfamily phosphatase/phosphodiesterase